MTSQDLQILLKNNSEELQDYLKDLKNWEKDIKLEDLKLTENKNLDSKGIPPVRNKRAISKSVAMKKNSKQNEKKIQSSRISSYDYDAWDKFDVDKALESESEDDSAEHETKNNNNRKRNRKDSKENCDSSESSSKIERAERLKEEGNLCYAQGKLSDAIAKYTQGIGLNPSNSLLPANRAMAYIKLKKYKAAENDCTKALSLDPNYIKAYLRRATARANLENISGAIEDYEKVLKLEPWNTDAKKELDKLETERRKLWLESVPPLEDVIVSGKQKKNQVKKMKIEEIDGKTQAETSTQIHVTSKPVHVQSMKPLIHVPVVEVSSREKLEDILNVKKRTKSSTSNIVEQFSSPQKVEFEKPSLPKPPRTSHQLAQDWLKINKHNALKHLYLKSIRVSFFNGVEVETDLLFEIIDELNSEAFEADVAASIMAALMTTRGFYLNVAFLDAQQKKDLEKIIVKIENCDSVKENVQRLRECL